MDQVQAFYDTNAQYEWDRLLRHRTEFAINVRLLQEYLPQSPCAILDVGGGPGRYAVHLAQAGHKVTLLDLSAECLAFARARAEEAGVTLAGTIHGNALNLASCGDESFDALLLMGPMYHLLEESDRVQALQEARRVLKPGGLLAVSFLNRYARVMAHPPEWTIANLAHLEGELATAIRRDVGGGWTDAFCIHPADVHPLLIQNGFTYLQMVASEGLRSEGETAHLAGADWDAWVDLNYRLSKDPCVHGASIHLLAVGRKR